MGNAPHSAAEIGGNANSYAELISDLMYDLLGNTGIRLSVLDTEGDTISRQGVMDIICQYAQSYKVTSEACHRCCKQGLKIASSTGQPYTYRCYMGLAVTIFPLIRNRECVGYLLLNGYFMEPDVMEKLPQLSDSSNSKKYFPDFDGEEKERLFLPQAKVQAIIQTFSTTISYLMELNDQVRVLMSLQDKSLELLTSANIREQSEKKSAQKLAREANEIQELEFFFNALDHISAVAYEEKAEKTGRLLQDLSSHIRKGTQPGASVTLGEELDDIRTLLDLLKSMYGERINFRLEVGTECSPDADLAQIPFATLTDVLIEELLDEKETGGILVYQLHQRPGFLDVAVYNNCGRLPPQAADRLNHMIQNTQNSTERTERVLFGLLAEQTNLYGSLFSWKISSDPGKQTRILLNIPLKDEIS